jgi:hypothetical protein
MSRSTSRERGHQSTKRRQVTGRSMACGHRSTRRITGGIKPPCRRITRSMRWRSTGGSKPPRRRIWKRKGSTRSSRRRWRGIIERSRGSREGAAVAWSPDRRCLVTGHAPWPHRWLKKWRNSLVARSPYHGCCVSRASMAPPNIQGKCWALENTSSFQGHCCKPNFGPNPLFLGLRPI